MHPEIVSDKYAEKHLLIKSLRNCRFIGEVGIDGSTRYRGSIEKQIEIFTEVVQESEILGGRILSIHSRSAASKVLDIIEDKGIMSTFILHWFSGSLSQLKRAVDLGCLFSVGPAMTNSSNGRQLLSHMPLTRVLPESDGPFATRGLSSRSERHFT
jgi:TatD DNase family protein